MNPPFTSAGPLGPQDCRTAVVNLPITIAGPRRPLRPQWRIYSSPLMGSSISMPYTPPHFPKAGFGSRAANMVFNKTELYNHKQPRLQLLACFDPSRNSPVHQVWPVSRPLLNCSPDKTCACCLPMVSSKPWQKQFHKSRTQTTICQLQGLQTEKVEARKHPTGLYPAVTHS